MPLFCPGMREGGLRSKSVMLCGRGLRATHIHRPLTTCFRVQNYTFSPIPQALRRKKLDFPEKSPIFAAEKHDNNRA